MSPLGGNLCSSPRQYLKTQADEYMYWILALVKKRIYTSQNATGSWSFVPKPLLLSEYAIPIFRSETHFMHLQYAPTTRPWQNLTCQVENMNQSVIRGMVNFLYARRRRVILCRALRPSFRLSGRPSDRPLTFRVRSITPLPFKIFS